MRFQNVYDWEYRDKVVSELGFADYEEYLKSRLWKDIRDRVLEDNSRCHCGVSANQVHHSKYTKKNLTGESIYFLHSVCENCHRIEHDSGNTNKVVRINHTGLPGNVLDRQLKQQRRRTKAEKASARRERRLRELRESKKC